MCFAFSLPPTPFTRQVNRATAETAQEAARDEGLAPLMGWVKRLADQVIQDVMGHADLEFAWADLRPAAPAEQAKIIDTYVRDGVYAVNEARALLGLDPVPGGDRPMICDGQGAGPLGTISVSHDVQRRSRRDAVFDRACQRSVSHARGASLRKDDSNDEDEFDVAAGGRACEGFSGGCQSGGSYGSSALYSVLGRNLCMDCAVKTLGLENEPAATKVRELDKHIIDPQ